MKVLVTQSCLTLCDPTDCSHPSCSVHGILQAILEWVAISFFREDMKWKVKILPAELIQGNHQWFLHEHFQTFLWINEVYVCSPTQMRSWYIYMFCNLFFPPHNYLGYLSTAVQIDLPHCFSVASWNFIVWVYLYYALLLKKKLFYFWLCWGFVAVPTFLWLRRAGATLVAAHRLLTVVASRVEHEL